METEDKNTLYLSMWALSPYMEMLNNLYRQLLNEESDGSVLVPKAAIVALVVGHKIMINELMAMGIVSAYEMDKHAINYHKGEQDAAIR